MINGGNVTDQS